jgi:16S rRNA (guanine(527)-N(7))-methyltransferase RsmG
MSFRELLAAEFAPYATLTARQLDVLDAHWDLLQRWNHRINLTRVSGIEEAVRLHYCESLFLATMLPPGPLRIADVGSGAGFPGIPVAVLRDDCMVTLIESHARKTVFLREAARGLGNVQIFAGRAERCPAEFDWIISRAVRSKDVLKLNVKNGMALLVGAEDARGMGGDTKVPWGENRRVVVVSRGTVSN